MLRGDNPLYSARNGQQATIGPVLANHHQTDRQCSLPLDRQSDGAPIEKVDDGRVAQKKPVKAKVFAIVGKRGDRRRRYRDRRHQQGVEIDRPRSDPRHEVGASGAYSDIGRGTDSATKLNS